MNEYKNPIKNMWQQANQPIEGGNNVQLPYQSGVVDPTAAGIVPAKVGLMYIDTAAGKVYVSTGTSVAADWKALN